MPAEKTPNPARQRLEADLAKVIKHVNFIIQERAEKRAIAEAVENWIDDYKLRLSYGDDRPERGTIRDPECDWNYWYRSTW